MTYLIRPGFDMQPHIRNLLIFCFIIKFISGCASTTKSFQVDKITHKSSFTKVISQSAKKAFMNPNTWVPLTAATAIGVAGFDKTISSWASRNTYIYNSKIEASDTSDVLRKLSNINYNITLFATPDGKNLDDYMSNKLLSLGFTNGARTLVSGTTNTLKHKIGRERPDSSDLLSFPSGHTSSAVTHSILSQRFLEKAPIKKQHKTVLNLYYNIVGWGTAWGRVEAEKHYPTDILIGASIASFVSNFFYNAFIDNESKLDINIVFNPNDSLGTIQLNFPI